MEINNELPWLLKELEKTAISGVKFLVVEATPINGKQSYSGCLVVYKPSSRQQQLCIVNESDVKSWSEHLEMQRTSFRTREYVRKIWCKEVHIITNSLFLFLFLAFVVSKVFSSNAANKNSILLFLYLYA